MSYIGDYIRYAKERMTGAAKIVAEDTSNYWSYKDVNWKAVGFFVVAVIGGLIVIQTLGIVKEVVD